MKNIKNNYAFPLTLNYNYAIIQTVKGGNKKPRQTKKGSDTMKELLAKFSGRADLIQYTAAVWDLLATDPGIEYILDGETGEVLLAK